MAVGIPKPKPKPKSKPKPNVRVRVRLWVRLSHLKYICHTYTPFTLFI